MSDAATTREPLSQTLARILHENHHRDRLTLNQLLAATGGRGLHLFVILLCLPFITPIPLPGLSSVVGAILAILVLREALSLQPRLPKLLGDRAIEVARHQKFLTASLKFLRFVEKCARPRGRFWLQTRAARAFNGLVILVMAGLLILPFPPFVFFTNSLPAYGAILVAASEMEEDGFLIWLGYAVALVAFVYVGVLTGGVITAFGNYQGILEAIGFGA